MALPQSVSDRIDRDARPVLRVAIRLGLSLVFAAMWAYLIASGRLGLAWDVIVTVALLGMAGISVYYAYGLWVGDYEAEELPPGPS